MKRSIKFVVFLLVGILIFSAALVAAQVKDVDSSEFDGCATMECCWEKNKNQFDEIKASVEGVLESIQVGDCYGACAPVRKRCGGGTIHCCEGPGDCCYENCENCGSGCSECIETCIADQGKEVTAALEHQNAARHELDDLEDECKEKLYAKWAEDKEGEKEDEEEPKTARIKAIRGEAEIDKGGNDIWVDARKGMTLAEGDYISTDFESEVDLIIDGHEVIIRELTQIKMDSLLEAAADPKKLRRFVIELRIGSIQATVKRKAAVPTDFKIVTPVATTAVRGTTFSVKYDDKTMLTEVFVEEGEVAVSDKEEENEVIVGKNEYTSVSEGQPPQEPIRISQIAEEDRWWEEEKKTPGYLWIIGGIIIIAGIAAYIIKMKKK